MMSHGRGCSTQHHRQQDRGMQQDSFPDRVDHRPIHIANATRNWRFRQLFDPLLVTSVARKELGRSHSNLRVDELGSQDNSLTVTGVTDSKHTSRRRKGKRSPVSAMAKAVTTFASCESEWVAAVTREPGEQAAA